MFSISTNNGLEGTNRMIKSDYTQRELLGLLRFILVVEQAVYHWSTDPERKEPLKVPTIPRNPNTNVRKAMEKLRNERRTVIHKFYREEHIWLVPSSNCPADAYLEDMWSELRGKDAEENPRWRFSSWHRYKELRGSFYELKKSHVYPGYLCCTCPVGIKDELCKHALLLMETEEMTSPLPRPLEPRKREAERRKLEEPWKEFNFVRWCYVLVSFLLFVS